MQFNVLHLNTAATCSCCTNRRARQQADDPATTVPCSCYLTNRPSPCCPAPAPAPPPPPPPRHRHPVLLLGLHLHPAAHAGAHDHGEQGWALMYNSIAGCTANRVAGCAATGVAGSAACLGHGPSMLPAFDSPACPVPPRWLVRCGWAPSPLLSTSGQPCPSPSTTQPHWASCECRMAA